MLSFHSVLIILLPQELTHENLWPALERTRKLRQLCVDFHTIPTSYKLEGVTREGDPQRVSQGITVWKGRYKGEAVTLKVFEVSRQDPHIAPFKRVSTLCDPLKRRNVRCCPDG